MWRQGDILIERVQAIPPELPRLKRLVLATGDSTGQRHQIKERHGVQLFGRTGGEMFLMVDIDEAAVVHPEHGPIRLKRGNYRVWKQREFADERTRAVQD